MAEDTFIYSGDWPHQTLDPPTWFYTPRAFDEDLRDAVLHENAEDTLGIQPAMSADPQIKDDHTKVASVEDIPRGRGIAVNANGIEIVIFNIKGEFYVLSNRCPHQNAPLYKVGEEKINVEYTWMKSRGGVNEEELSVSCPWHL